jgi:hypothetical protein
MSAHRCSDRCSQMGICQALEGCQDQHRIDAEMTKPTKMAEMPEAGQSRRHSMAETLVSIAVGFGVAMAIQALLLPAMGHHITWSDNFWMTCVFTVASLLRGYGMRRLFNHLHTHGGRP